MSLAATFRLVLAAVAAVATRPFTSLLGTFLGGCGMSSSATFRLVLVGVAVVATSAFASP